MAWDTRHFLKRNWDFCWLSERAKEWLQPKSEQKGRGATKNWVLPDEVFKEVYPEAPTLQLFTFQMVL